MWRASVLGASACCIYMYADGVHEHSKDNVVLSPVRVQMERDPPPASMAVHPGAFLQSLYLAVPAGSCCFADWFSSVPLSPGPWLSSCLFLVFPSHLLILPWSVSRFLFLTPWPPTSAVELCAEPAPSACAHRAVADSEQCVHMEHVGRAMGTGLHLPTMLCMRWDINAWRLGL